MLSKGISAFNDAPLLSMKATMSDYSYILNEKSGRGPVYLQMRTCICCKCVICQRLARLSVSGTVRASARQKFRKKSNRKNTKFHPGKKNSYVAFQMFG